MDGRQTIFALASGSGRAGIAVIRLSGPAASRALAALVGQCPPPRRATLRKIVDPINADVLDFGLILWFPGPNSFTGEDCAELHIHGGRAVVAAILQSLGALKDLRPAKAGEFARRALENGKLDLIDIEALGDLINAETEQQRRFAIVQTEGHLGERAEKWRRSLIDALVLVESELDFSDEADAPRASRDRILIICREIAAAMEPLVVQRFNRRALARRVDRTHRRTAECRKIDTSQRYRQARHCDCLRARGDDARLDRGEAGSCRISRQFDRHRWNKAKRGPDRAGGNQSGHSEKRARRFNSMAFAGLRSTGRAAGRI